MSFVKDINIIILHSYYALKSFMAYRSRALLFLIDESLAVLMSFLAVSVIYGVSSGIAGWTYYQMLMLTATMSIFAGIYYYFVSAHGISQKLLHGEADIYLMRPVSKVAALIVMGLLPSNLGMSVTGLCIAVFALSNMHVTLLAVIGYIILFGMASMAMIFFGTMLSVLSYRMFQSGNFVNRLTHFSSTTLGNYPLTVYGKAGQLLFTLLIPFGLAYYYPVRALLGDISPTAYFAAIALCIAVAGISYLLFDLMVKEYSSGGG